MLGDLSLQLGDLPPHLIYVPKHPAVNPDYLLLVHFLFPTSPRHRPS